MKKSKPIGSKKRLASKIYSFIGDDGFTRTLHGCTLSKDHCLIEVHGDIDALQSMIDKLIAYAKYSDSMAEQKPLLSKVQLLLWQLGGELSQKKVGGLVTKPIGESDVADLEKTIDSFELDLHEFQRFNNLIAIDVNETRIRTRKLERTLTEYLKKSKIRPEVYKYINRLSDYFFALAVKIQQEERDI